MTATLSTRRRNRRFGIPILTLVSSTCILIAIGLFIFSLVQFSQQDDRLPADIRVAGVQVGGLTNSQAKAQWEQAFAEPLVLYYQDSPPILLNPDEIGWSISSDPMLAQALATGTTGSGFWQRFLNYLLGQENSQATDIPLQATYQVGSLRTILEDIQQRYDRPPGKPGFDLATLTTYPGTGGFALDIETAMVMIDSALRNPVNRSEVLPVISDNLPQPTLDTLEEMLIGFLDSRGFIYDGQSTVASIFILDLQTGDEINILGDVTFSAASTIKVGIMIDFYRYLAFPPTQDEAWLMANSLLCSNNSSSNLLMQIVGGNDQFAGIASVTNTLQFLGADNSYITAPFYLGVEGQTLGSIPPPRTSPNPSFNTNPDPFNQTTAEDMGTLFTMIYDCAEFNSGLASAYPNGEITQNECRQMIELMSANDLERLLQGGIPTEVRISHKNGWIFDTVGDTGIVYSPNGRNYIISVYLWEETEFQDYEKLWPLVEEISRATWNFFNPENALLEARRDLPISAQECEGNYLPPSPEQVDLDNINSWRENR